MKIAITAFFVGIAACVSVQPAAATEAAGWKEKVLYSFCSQKNCADGYQPEAGLTEVNGTLYGTTDLGGLGGFVNGGNGGTVFSLDPATGAETVLYSFCTQSRCQDGADPHADLFEMNGALYGTTSYGGRRATLCFDRCGLIFSLDPTTGAETALYAFCRNKDRQCVDGVVPVAGLTAVNGTLYGTTTYGGDLSCEGINGCGTLFALDPGTGSLTVLHTFEGGTDGYSPEGDLVYAKGELYGTTYGNTVFRFDLKTGEEKALYRFCSQAKCADGNRPEAGVIAAKGTLYGTTKYGGASDYGVVFALNLSTGVETVLHSFAGADGAYPLAGLIDMGGTLYGTTSGGAGGGAVFSVDPATGAETVIHAFKGAGDGSAPLAGLLAVKHKLYGTTSAGGAYGKGTVFMLKPKS